MGQKVFQKSFVIILLLGVLMSMLWIGCASTVSDRRGEAVTGGESGSSKYSGKYYNFDDVLIPAELKYKPKKSFVYETPHFKTGILFFSKFWLDSGSLIDFFTLNMQKDNWKLINSFRGKESFLNFSKPEKTCTIKIVENWYGTTEVEIRIGPLGEKPM